MTEQREKKEAVTQSASPDRKKKKKKGNPWVENIESLVVAVVLALIIRVFVVEAFVIPTGSMAGSLYGNHYDLKCPNCGFGYALGQSSESQPVQQRVLCPNCGFMAPGLGGASGGDRILVNKVLYRFDQPKRWDPFVFVNPTCSKRDYPPKTTYIKRLIGLPGDRLEILRGDIVVDGYVQRKPAAAQEALWMPVYDGRYVWAQRPEGKPWRADGKTWRLDGARLVADAPPGVLAWADYSGRIGKDSNVRDTYGYDQDLGVRDAPFIGNGAGLNVVTDLRVSFDVKGNESGKLVLSLACDDSDDRAIIEPDEYRVTLTHAGKEVASALSRLLSLSTEKPRHVAFYRVDYLLAVDVDGVRLVEHNLWSPEEYQRLLALAREGRLEGHTRSGVRLGAEGARLELSALRIDRDVYYTYPQQRTGEGNQYVGPWDIAEGQYFAMGDNSPESWDSRYWGIVPANHLIGKALVIWWHPLRAGLIR